ncbi:ROK family protein [Streptomyces sp. NPDC056069]|uniref:ROK family transcriptional regulator n=1 Tax=Streptomyces sp. NPDC056069 TaxID=3345702 RepID=UPI0035E16334
MNRDNGGVASGANLPALRSHNAALVLDLLRTAGEGGISRLELAERTGLTPQAVSKITARLRAEGLAAEAGRRASTGGKPATVLRLVPAAAHAIGLHLDRDELTAVLLDLAGTRVAAHRVPLDLGAGADAVLAVVAEEVAALTALTAMTTLTTGRGASTGAYPAPASPRVSTSAPASASDAAPASIAAASPASVAASAATSEAAPASVSVSASAPISAVGPTSASAPAVGPASASAPAADSASAPAPAAASAPAADPASASAYAPVPGAVLGVGVAMPGPLDHRTGTPGRVTGFPEWDGFPLREELARRLGLPVVLDKDTNAAALGLALRPDAPDSFAYVHLGTGLGAGLVLGGAVLRGGRTGAGELGHQTVQLDGPPCDCGGRGCLEVLCLTALAHGDRAEAARILGTGAANLVRLLDIDRVLLGGRAVLADPEAYARGAREVLAGLGLSADVGVAVAPYAVTEGAAQLILAPIFGK